MDIVEHIANRLESAAPAEPTIERPQSAPENATSAPPTIQAPPRELPTESKLPARTSGAVLPDAERSKPFHTLKRKIAPEAIKKLRVVFQKPPVIAGQSIDDYFQLAEAAYLENPTCSFTELSLLRQLVDDEWKIITFCEVQTSLLNFAIAQSVIERLAEIDSWTDDMQTPAQQRRLVFAAIAGDQAKVTAIETALGQIGFDAMAAKHMLVDIRAHVYADGVMNATQKRITVTIRELEKMRGARRERREAGKPNPEDLARIDDLPESARYCLSLVDARID